MTFHNALPLVAPKVAAPLHPSFRPAVLAMRQFDALVSQSADPVPVRIALEQTDGSAFHFHTRLLPAGHPQAAANAIHLERFVKFILWSRGGWRIFVDGPDDAVARARGPLSRHADRPVRFELRRREGVRSTRSPSSDTASCLPSAR